MGGVTGFLLGGAIGAALGFLISRKQSQKIQNGEAQPLSSTGKAPAAASGAATVVPWAPTVETEAPVEEPFAVVEEPAAEEPAIEEAPVAPESEPEVPPEVEFAPEDEPAAEIGPAREVGAVPWAPTVETEASVEEPFAIVEEPAIEEPAIEEAPVTPESEPESPVDSPELAAVVAEAETESEAAATPEVLEELLPAIGWEPPAALAGEEQGLFEEFLPLVPEGTLADSSPEVESSAAPPAADDLRARIEETRRRIRMELEKPFVDMNGGVAAAEGVATEEIATRPPSEPVIGEALMQPPLMDGLSSSVVAEHGAAREQPASELGLDYDAMRGRIETTRDRLKAKAFDAMMTGESALLGRDPAEAAGERPAAADVDSEIAQTIETTLREEEG